MIASANSRTFKAQIQRAARQTKDPAWHERFLQMMPSISNYARIRFRGLPAPHRQEAVDDVVALALVASARLVELGKEDLAYATPLARYAVAQYRAGRRVGVRMNSHDVLSDVCRRKHGLTIERVDRFDQSSGEWREALVEDKRFGPADAAATRIDVGAWLKSLTKRNRRVAERLATGESTERVARCFGVTAGRISQLRRELREAWGDFQGEVATAL